MHVTASLFHDFCSESQANYIPLTCASYCSLTGHSLCFFCIVWIHANVIHIRGYKHVGVVLTAVFGEIVNLLVLVGWLWVCISPFQDVVISIMWVDQFDGGLLCGPGELSPQVIIVVASGGSWRMEKKVQRRRGKG